MKKKIIIGLIFGIINSFYSQPINITSPQSMEFQRYGNVPVNLSVGAIDLSIPIFENPLFNISLNYNSSGFIPSKKSNYVGYNWSLNLGGVIVRETIGQDDDFQGENPKHNQGFLYFTKDNKFKDEELYNKKIFNYEHWGYKTELTSDKYHFSFMGISGYFYINSLGKAVSVSNDPNLKIDITKMHIQYHTSRCIPEKNTEITITDGKGNKYIFGGSYDNLEISYDQGLFLKKTAIDVRNHPNSEYNGIPLYSIKGWYLREIKYTNNQNIIINYKQYDNLEWESFCYVKNIINTTSREGFFDVNYFINKTLLRTEYKFDISTGGERILGKGSGYSHPAPYYQMQLLKKVFPKSVIIDNKEKIEFIYKNIESSYPQSDFIYRDYIKVLDQIHIKSLNNDSIYQIKLDYNRNKDYIFLKKIRINDKYYTFDYYNTKELPEYTTFGIDHWGYWNGGSEDAENLIPKYSFNFNTGEYKLLGNSRDPNPNLINTGLLHKVFYPTDGYSEFIYEPHDYSLKIDQNPSSNFIKTIIRDKGYVGGARIRKIINTDKEGGRYIREFKYVNSKNESSGILLDVLRYIHYENYSYGGTMLNYKKIHEKNKTFLYSALSNSPIEYERIIEYKNNNLYKEYFYTTYKTDPDSLSYKYIQYKHPTILPKDMNKHLYLRYMDFGNRRRKIIKEVFYDDKMNKIKDINYEYINLNKTIEDQANEQKFKKEHIVAIETNKQDFQYTIGTFYYIDYFYHNLLKQIEEIDYLKGKVVQRNTKNFYDDISLNKKKIEVTDINKIETTYQYANEKGNQYLIDKNMVGIPLETTITQNGKVISKTETKYPTSQSEADQKTNGLPLPISVLSSDLETSNKVKEDIVYTKYDDKGNILEYKVDGIVPVTIIWGYQNTLPIAKIEGATYEQVKHLITDIIAKSNEDQDESSEIALISSLDEFRKRAELSSYQVTTYTHNPLIGVTSITPPSGVREMYIYDEANRLKQVLDKAGNIIKEYDYHYGNRSINNGSIINNDIINNIDKGSAYDDFIKAEERLNKNKDSFILVEDNQ